MVMISIDEPTGASHQNQNLVGFDILSNIVILSANRDDYYKDNLR